ncbi:MAG: ABC transporter permease [Vicinamibacteria bacterium]
MSTFLGDLRFAVRTLGRSPGLTAAVVLTLALGVGANTAIFSMVDGLLLRPLPIRDPGQVVFLGFPQGSDNLDVQFSLSEMQTLREQSRPVLSSVAGMAFGGVEGGQSGQDGLTVDGQTRPLQTLFVAGDFFGMLGIAPAVGRLLLPAEATEAAAEPVVVLSHRYWETRFGAEPSIVGRRAAINGRPVTIVGIAPKSFLGLTPIVETQGYLPLSMLVPLTGAIRRPAAPEPRLLTLVARLESGASLDAAQSALAVVGQRLFRERPRANARDALRLRPLRPPGLITGTNPLPRLAGLFLILAALVLLLACVNVANLLLVRAAARQREMAIRAALGAARARLIRQLLTEAALLGILGGLAGTLMGLFGSDVVSTIPIQSDMPLALDFHFDWRTFAFALALALTATLAAGVVPAFRASGGNLSEGLRSGGRTHSGGSGRVRGALVAVQIAGSLALLIVAGLFTRSLLAAQAADLGFDPRNVLNVTLDPHEIGYDQSRAMAFHRDLLERARGLPGVQSVSLTRIIPLSDTTFSDGIETAERPAAAPDAVRPPVLYDAVSPGNFRTLNIPLLRGRDFADADGEGTARVAIINEAMAERFWPAEDPVGRVFRRSSDPSTPVEIIALVKNARLDAAYGPFQPCFYVPLTQDYASLVTLQLRSGTPDAGLARSVVQLVGSLAPSMPVLGTRTMSRAIRAGMNGLLLFEVGAGLAGALGCLGLVLALVGIYGVMSYSVSLRTFELGIRMALGAQRSEILGLVGRQALAVVVGGIALGLLAAWATAGLIADFLVDVAPTDPSTYGGVSAVLAAVALTASYVPLRRAMQTDPNAALRHE